MYTGMSYFQCFEHVILLKCLLRLSHCDYFLLCENRIEKKIHISKDKTIPFRNIMQCLSMKAVIII